MLPGTVAPWNDCAGECSLEWDLGGRLLQVSGGVGSINFELGEPDLQVVDLAELVKWSFDLCRSEPADSAEVYQRQGCQNSRHCEQARLAPGAPPLEAFENGQRMSAAEDMPAQLGP